MGMDISGGNPVFGAVMLLLVLLLGLVWLVVGIALALKGEPVEKPSRIAQLYGYTVCLIALIVGLVSTAAVLNAVMDRANPLQADDPRFGIALGSFESFTARREFERGSQPRFPGDTAQAVPETAAEQRARYDALVADRIANVRYRTAKVFLGSGILLLLSTALFLLHWRWLRRQATG